MLKTVLTVTRVKSWLKAQDSRRARKQLRGCSDDALWCLLLTGRRASSVMERDAKP